MNGIELIDVTKRFGSEAALDGVSLSAGEGETLALFGPSGAGKTVLLRVIAGLAEPDEGAVRLGGEEATWLPPERRGVGMAFQNFALFPHMSAMENIASPIDALGRKGEERKSAVEAVAKLLKIDHVLGHAPRALSNGQKQRTALARALAAEPKVLLLDDPLRNVDAKLRFEMRLELPRLLARRRATTIYVTQDFREAMALGDRVAVLLNGRLAQIGAPREIYERPATAEIARLFGDPAMNMLRTRPARDAEGLYAPFGGARIALPPELAAAEGRNCLLGVRPEAFFFAAPDAPGAIPVEVEAETPLNEKIVTLTRSEDKTEILVSRPTGTDAPARGRAGLAVDPARILLFDEADSVLIARSEGDPA